MQPTITPKMRLYTACLCVGVAPLMTPAPIFAQQLLERYTTEIAPEDRVNSGGVTLIDPSQILAQDRANFHRFEVRQPGDSADGYFGERTNRAALAQLVERGSISPDALAVLTGARAGTLSVEIYGSGGVPASVNVTLAETEAAAATALPQFDVATDPAAWTFSTGPHEWRGIATTFTITDQRVAFECTRVGSDPAQYPGDTTIWPHEAGLFNFFVTAPALDASAQAGPYNIEISVDGQVLGVAPMAYLADRDELATNVPVEHPLLTAIKGGNRLGLRDTQNGTVFEVTLSGSGDALDRLGAFCTTPLPAAESTMTALPTLTPEVPETAPAPASAATGPDGLVTLDGRVVHWGGSVQDSSFNGTPLQLADQAQRLSSGLYFAALAASSDDLRASLASAQSEAHLRQQFDRMPEDNQRQLAVGIVDLIGGDQAQKDRCMAARGNRIWFCTTSTRNVTEFDRRRITDYLATEIAAYAATAALPVPLPIYVFCGGARLDTVYDFETRAVNWGRFIGDGACQQSNMPLSYGINAGSMRMQGGYRIPEALPNSTPMDAALVEELNARAAPRANRMGEFTLRPYAVTFPGEVTIRRTGRPGGNFEGMHEVEIVFSRTGPADLRWTGAPLDIVMTFEPEPEAAAPEAVDFRSAANIAALIETAEPLDPLDAAEAYRRFREESAEAGATQVRLPAYLNERGDAPAFTIPEFGYQANVVKSVAVALEVPPEYIGWTQIQSQTGGVPDVELILALPRALNDVRTDPVPAEVVSAADGAAALVATIEYVHTLGGEAGGALFAFVRPLYFEAMGPDGFGGQKIIANLALAEPPASEAFVQLFVPTANWYLLKAAEQRGQEPRDVFDEAYQASNMFGADVFERLDAVEAGIATARKIAEGNADRAPWILGTLNLDAYDLDREAYPVRQMQITLPAMDQLESRISARAAPYVETRDLYLPIPMDEARAMREVLSAGPSYRFRARISVIEPGESTRPDRVNAQIEEIAILPPERGSQRAGPQTAFVPGDEILTVVLNDG